MTVMASADGEVNQAVTVAINETVDYHAGRTNPANPEMPQLPQVFSHAIDAVIAEDYANDDIFYEGSMYWGWYDGSSVNELRFFSFQATNRSQLPTSFPDLHQASRDLERGLAERREFELPYDLMMEGYYNADDALSTFEMIGRLGDYYHEFVRTNIEVPTGAVGGLGDGVVYAFTDTGTGADHAFGSSSAPKAQEFSAEYGNYDDTDTTDDPYAGAGLAHLNFAAFSGFPRSVPP